MDFKELKLSLLIVFICFACSKPTALEDNPLDPVGGDYQIPVININTEFLAGETVTFDAITIEFSGNEMVTEFRYKLDNNDWSEWSDQNIVLFDYLDEGSHTVFAQSRYISLDESEIHSLDFIVDAVPGPALMFEPRRQIVSTGDIITFNINAEEVVQLAGTEFVLTYDPASITVESINSGNIFSQTGDPIMFTDVDLSDGTVTITAAVWGTGEPAFTGTGAIVELNVKVLQTGEIDILFDGTEVYRNHENSNIEISESIPGKIFSN
jgi:hypothetical protein